MKKYINRYTISSVMVLAMVFFCAFATLFSNRQQIAAALRADTFRQNGRQQVEEVFDDHLTFKDRFLSLWGSVQYTPFHAKGRLYDDAEYGFIIQDAQGSLLFPYHQKGHEAIERMAQNTAALAEAADKAGAQFVYVQAPNKNIRGYTVLPAGADNTANEDADDFLQTVGQYGVDTFDLRETLFSTATDKESLFFKTDHHWTAPTAFLAYTQLTAMLQERYGLVLDPDGFYTNIENWQKTEFPNSYLGSLGRRVGQVVSGLDDYTFISPRFNTNYTLYNGLADREKPAFEGDFMTAIAKPDILNSEDVEANKHAAYFEWDYGNLIIKNHLAENDTKIMLIKDSYSLPLAAFLSTCVSELHMIDMREAGTSPTQYIAENDIDMVIVLYNAEGFENKMFDFLR